jgi:hypothetical protein
LGKKNYWFCFGLTQTCLIKMLDYLAVLNRGGEIE